MKIAPTCYGKVKGHRHEHYFSIAVYDLKKLFTKYECCSSYSLLVIILISWVDLSGM